MVMAGRTPLTLSKPVLLLVEGTGDARFFTALLNRLGRDDVQVWSVGGKDKFRPFIASLPSLPNFASLNSLNVIRDADDNPGAAFQSVRDALRDAGFPGPSSAFGKAENDALSASVAIIPDADSPGSLEDLCWRSIEGLTEAGCIEEYMECLGRDKIARNRLSKTKIYALLAVGDRPGLRLGEAAESGVWNWDSAAFRQIAEYLSGI